jgi:hypothetical protein
MKSLFLVAIFFALPILSINSCSTIYDKDYGEINYTGDGKFTDKGRDASRDRFLLDLGQVELNQKSKSSYTIKGLPETSFTIALQVDLPVSNNFPLESPTLYPPLQFTNETVLSLEMEDVDGKKLFNYNGPLSKLNRNVRRTEKGYKPIYYLERQAAAPGTSFTPKNKMTYRLNISVIQAYQSAPKISVIAVGHSGWK